MNRIDQLLQQMIAETSQQVLPTVYSATMLAGLQELQGLTRSIAEQRAFAQQPAQAAAVPDGWKLVPVEPTEQILDALFEHGMQDEDDDVIREAYRAMLAAAPAAPVVREPVAFVSQETFSSDGTSDILTRNLPIGTALYAVPPAAEQAPRELLTCIGKGGRYELLGESSGAGGCRREGRVIYRCLDTGQLYHRTDDDFAARMAPLHTAPPAAEQPDAWTPSVADYDRNIHRNPDAAAWADLFVATFPGLADKHDLMLGWFANAMMAMHDFLKAEQPGTVAVPRELLDCVLHEADLLLDRVNSLLQYAGSTGDDAQHGEAVSRMRALLAGGAE